MTQNQTVTVLLAVSATLTVGTTHKEMQNVHAHGKTNTSDQRTRHRRPDWGEGSRRKTAKDDLRAKRSHGLGDQSEIPIRADGGYAK